MGIDKNQARRLLNLCLSSTIMLYLGGCAMQQSKVSSATTHPADRTQAQPHQASVLTPATALESALAQRPAESSDASSLGIPGSALPDLWESVVTLAAQPDPEPAPVSITNVALSDSTLLVNQKSSPEPAKRRSAGPIAVPRKKPATDALAPATAASTDSRSSMVSPVGIDDAPNNQDMWNRIRTRFSLPDRDHPRVQSSKNWYASRQVYLDRTIERATPYLHYIVEEIERRGMPSELALLPIVESAYQPLANSHAKAAGIWQFIPSTAKNYGLKLNWWYDGRRDIHASTRAALDYLQKLNADFQGDWLLALAAYNAGEGAVMRAVNKNAAAGKPTDFWSLQLPIETQGYVPWLLAITDVVAAPEKFGITLKSVPNQPYLTTITTDTQIDLALAAELADVPLEEVHRLNPGFNRWVTDPDGPHHLLLPIEKVESFKTRLASLPTEKRVTWTRHHVQKKQSLSYIARLYGTTTTLLRQINKLTSDIARASTDLLVPVATSDLGSYALRIAQNSTSTLQVSQNTSSTDEPKAKGKTASHTVGRGDTLWKVARKFGVTPRELATWNDLTPKSRLSAGQRLVIRSATGTTQRLTLSRASSRLAKADTTLRRISYKIRPGDTLTHIADRFDVTLSELRKWNTPAKIKSLKPGQKLTLVLK